MGHRPADSADRISNCAILLAGVVGGVLVFVVALPLALSSPFPTPKQSEWIIESSLESTASGAPTLVPPPMEPLPQALAAEPEVTGALGDAPSADDVEAEPKPERRPIPMAFAARWDLTIPPRNDAPRIEVPPEATKLPPADSIVVAPPAKHRDTAGSDPVEQYLWEGYKR